MGEKRELSPQCISDDEDGGSKRGVACRLSSRNIRPVENIEFIMCLSDEREGSKI